MPKQFTLRQRIGQRTTIDREEGPAAPRPIEMDRMCHQLLAAAALTSDEDRALRIGHAFDLVEHRLHGGTLSDQLVEMVLVRQCLGESQILANEYGPFN